LYVTLVCRSIEVSAADSPPTVLGITQSHFGAEYHPCLQGRTHESAQLLLPLVQVSRQHHRGAAATGAARPTGAATAPAGGGLVAAAVLTEGVCSHDPATARAAAGQAPCLTED
jgi:hypothetical protein